MNRKELSRFMLDVGFKKQHKGFDYILRIIELKEKNETISLAEKAIALADGVKPQSVERAVKYAMEQAYAIADKKYLVKLFGESFVSNGSKPTAKDWICALSDLEQ